MNWKLTNFCEVDKYASKAYCAIHGVDESLNLGDITQVNPDEIEDFNMICGGSPCQDFSISGKKQGAMWTCKACGHTYNPLTVHWSNRDKCPKCESTELEMTRSSLLIEFLRIIRAKKPEWGIYENVKNIVGKAFKESFELFEKELQEYGYNTYYKVMNAKNYGVPQNRERLYLVFIRKDKDNGKFVFPEGFPLTIKLKDILEKDVDEKYYMNPDKVKVLTEALKARANNELHQVAQIYPDSGNPQAGRIYDANGISPTMDTCSGGNRMPKVLVRQATKQGYDVAEAYDTINLEQPGSMTRRGRVGKQVAQTINTAPQQVVVEPICIDKSVNEPREIEVANCITAREDRGVSNRKAEGTAVIESVNKLELTGDTEPLNTDADGNAYAIRSQYYKISAANLQSGKHSATGVVEGMNNYRIRKLTPTECFKLMSFEPEDVDAARSVGISNAQLYKMAGNSIVVDCLYYIYKELYKAMPYLFDDVKLGSFFSGIGAFERAMEKLEENTNE